ncbi:MAG: S16 family serine protease [Microthrixaceae bacterium]
MATLSGSKITHVLARYRWLVIGVLTVLTLSIVASQVFGQHRNHKVQVSALWFGTAGDGSPQRGVTKVDIAAVNDDPTSPLSVDLRGITSAGAGPMWTAATASAGVQAVLDSGVDPRVVQLTYSLQEAIDGPSAGALMAVGSLAALAGTKLNPEITMTGTALPDGSVGPVSGIDEKIRAAAAAGFNQVLVPEDGGDAQTPNSEYLAKLAETGRSVRVKVQGVRSIAQAFSIMTDSKVSVELAKPPPIDGKIMALLNLRSRQLIETTNSSLTQDQPVQTGIRSGQQSARITELLGIATTALQQGDAVLAFSAAAEAAQATRVQGSSERLAKLLAQAPLAVAVEQVRSESEQVKVALTLAVGKAAQTQIKTAAQLPALADALAWGVFALNSISVAQERLNTVTSGTELEEIAGFLEVAGFEGDTYMPVCAEAVAYLSGPPLADLDATVGLLNAYVDLLDYAADSNRVYAIAVGQVTTGSEYLSQLMAESDALTDSAGEKFPGLRGPTAEVSLRLAAALLDFVETTQLVNNLTVRSNSSKPQPPNLQPISNPQTVRNQAVTADEIALSQTRVIAAEGLDPSYVRWNKEWGANLAFGRLPNSTSEQLLHGLDLQWFAVLQSRLLIALAGETPNS